MVTGGTNTRSGELGIQANFSKKGQSLHYSGGQEVFQLNAFVLGFRVDRSWKMMEPQVVITANRWKTIPWDRIVTMIEEGLYAADVSFAKENTRKLCDQEYSNQSTSSWLKHAWSFLKGKRFIQSRESSFCHNLSYTWNKCTKRAFCDLLAVSPFFLCWSMRCTACFDVAHTPRLLQRLNYNKATW